MARSAVFTRALPALLAGMLAVSSAPGDTFAQARTAAEKAEDARALAEAREKFRGGLALEAAGNWDRALVNFKEVALVRSTPQVRYHIALCDEKTGDWVKAIGSYRLALHEASEASAKDVENAATAALAALEPKIPKLSLTKGEGAAMASIELDGQLLGANSFDGEMAVNPGAHVIKATAPDREPFEAELTLAESETKSLEIVLRLLPKASAEIAPVVAPKRDAAPPPEETSPLRLAGAVTAGVGGASLVAAGVFFALKQGAIGDLDAQCGPDRLSCPASARGTEENGRMFGTLSNVTFFAGLGLVAVGAAGFFLAPSTTSTSPTVGVALGARGADAGASLLGRF